MYMRYLSYCSPHGFTDFFNKIFFAVPKGFPDVFFCKIIKVYSPRFVQSHNPGEQYIGADFFLLESKLHI